ncbi:MAG: hypothetical protein RL211_466 [Pseudomonadota bacterium]|jgi:hypothetical protein
MKVLDLQCSHHHVFEGWFASEDDFASQLARGLVACPLCADVSIVKKLSAPRLNLGSQRNEPETSRQDVVAVAAATPDLSLQAAWLAMAQRVLANTDDVGDQFAEEARKIHYGEAKERGIRGKATTEERESLLEEGIAVVPIALPEALKGRLQ